MNCGGCRSENAPGRRFCRECGTALLAVCRECSFENELDAKHCGGCGRAVMIESASAASVSDERDRPTEIFHWMLAQAIEVTSAELRKKATLDGHAQVEESEPGESARDTEQGSVEEDVSEVNFASWEGIRFPFQPQQIAEALHRARES